MNNQIQVYSSNEPIGANCILAIRFETNELFEGMLDIVIYGTAVYCEWD
ncbi:heavy metal-binding domain-containing protein [Spiroplasma sp. AdecLV25b]|nr:heavy metal-binding domain-containing protein [Spiroplasma sp. AdecLV25b]